MSEGSKATAARADRLVAAVSVSIAAMTALIPQAAAPAVPAMAHRFAGEVSGELIAQMVAAAPALTMIMGAPLAGMLADKLGHRLTLLISLALFVVGGAGVLFIDDVVSLIVLRLIVGTAGGGMFTLGLAMISENFEGQARERLFGLVVLVSSSLAVTANTLGGALVDWFGWRASFALYLVGVPTFVIAWRVAHNPVREVREARSTTEGRLRQLAPVMPYYFLLMLLSIGIFLPYIQGGLVLEERGIASASIRGGIVSTTGILSASSGFFYGYFRRWLSASAIMVNNAFCIGAGTIVLAFAPTAWGVMLGCTLIGFGAGMSTPATASLSVSLTPPRIHAFALGLSFSFINLGEFINPLVLAPLKSKFGTAISFTMFGILLLMFGVLIAICHHRSKPGAALQAANAN